MAYSSQSGPIGSGSDSGGAFNQISAKERALLGSTFGALFDGTDLQIGVVGGRKYDRANLNFLTTVKVTDWGRHGYENPASSNNASTIFIGILNVLADYGQSNHHNIGSLPLQYAKGFRFGTNKVWVRLHFARDRWTPLQHPGENALYKISIRRGFERVKVYRSSLPLDESGNPNIDPLTLLPQGFILTDDVKDRDKPPKADSIRVPVYRIYASTRLSRNPIFFLEGAGLVGTLNSDEVYVGDDTTTFQAGALRYDGANADWDQGRENDDSIWTVDFAFTAREYGHLHQQYFWNDKIEGTEDYKFPDDPKDQWIVKDVVPYPRAWTAGSFP